MTRHYVETNDVKVVTLTGALQDRCSAESLLCDLRNQPRLLHSTARFQKIVVARRNDSTLRSEDGADPRVNKVARQQTRRTVCMWRRCRSFPGPYVTPASDKSGSKAVTCEWSSPKSARSHAVRLVAADILYRLIKQATARAISALTQPIPKLTTTDAFTGFRCGYKQRVPVRKCGAGAALRADVSPVSTLEVLAHLAQGDIPLLSAARTRRRVSPQYARGSAS